MVIKEKNYWLETVTTPPAQSARDLPDSIDVVVVGAGFCGLSAARTLAKRGVKVAVLEARVLVSRGVQQRNIGDHRRDGHHKASQGLPINAAASEKYPVCHFCQSPSAASENIVGRKYVAMESGMTTASAIG